MVTAGVDVGMRFAKICIVEDEKIVGSGCFEMSGNFRQRYKEQLKDTLAIVRESGVSSGRIKRIISTGYGSAIVPGVYCSIKESSSVAAAVSRIPYQVRTVIDAGGLFVKIHRINERGYVSGTVTNDKCASGSGRLLEITADALKFPIECIASMNLLSAEPFQITSSCAVFAESEIISRIGSGTPANDILAGVIRSIAAKTAALLENSRGEDPVVITGGLASVRYFVESFKNISGREIEVIPSGPRMSLAYGAALMGSSIKRVWSFRGGYAAPEER